jgi:hypothetical protein
MNKYLVVILVVVVALSVILGIAFWKGLDSFLFAWILNFMLMMCLLSYLNTFKPKLTSGYFTIKRWENEGKIYVLTGVNLFRKLLVLVGWEKITKAVNPVKNGLSALQQLEYGTRQAEFGHLIVFLIILATNILVAISMGLMASLWLIILNLLLNVYPLLLQRYNRPRFQRVILNYSNKQV